MLPFQEFKKRVAPTLENICRDLIRENKGKISVKKEEVAVRNMMRILEAVFALNREMGFETMSLRDLSRKSGLSMGALYSYFPGKEQLRSMILQRGVAYTREVIQGQAEACSGPVERLEVAMETHLFLTEVLRENLGVRQQGTRAEVVAHVERFTSSGDSNGPQRTEAGLGFSVLSAHNRSLRSQLTVEVGPRVDIIAGGRSVHTTQSAHERTS